MRLGGLWLASVATCASLAASSAFANVTTTFTGVVASGFDYAGEFGAPNTDLTGVGYTAVYTIDDSVASQQSINPNYTSVYGGTLPAGANPLSATLTINGTTVLVTGPYDGAVFQDYWPTLPNNSNLLGARDLYQLETQNEFAWNTQVQTLTNGIWSFSPYQSPPDVFTTNADYHTPLTHTVQSNDFATGAYQDWFNGDTCPTGFGCYAVNVLLTPTALILRP